MGDQTSHGSVIILGNPTVLIRETGSGAGGSGGVDAPTVTFVSYVAATGDQDLI